MAYAPSAMKLLLKIVVGAALTFALLFLAAWLLVPPAAKGAVEKGSRYAFGVPVTLDNLDASFGIGKSGLALEGYTVASPAEFEGRPLLEVQKLGLGVGTRSLLGEPKVVDELVLEGLELHLVQKGLQSNLWPVLQEVRKRLGSGEQPAPDAPETEDGPANPGPRLAIRRVRIAGLAASIDVSGIPGVDALSKRFELPAYEADWSQLSGPNGVTVAELSGRLLEEVTGSALVAAEGHVPAPALEVVRAALQGGLGAGVGGALDAAKDAAEDAAQKELDRLEERAGNELQELIERGAKKIGIEPGGAAERPAGPDGVQNAAEQAAEKVEKAAENAVEKASKKLEGLLPGGKKKPSDGGSS